MIGRPHKEIAPNVLDRFMSWTMDKKDGAALLEKFMDNNKELVEMAEVIVGINHTLASTQKFSLRSRLAGRVSHNKRMTEIIATSLCLDEIFKYRAKGSKKKR